MEKFMLFSCSSLAFGVITPLTLAQSPTCTLDSLEIDTIIRGGASYFNLGASVSMNGDGTIVAIGVPGYRQGWMWNMGRVNIFVKENGTWVFKQSLFGSQEEERFGTNVVLSGDGKRLIVTAPGYDIYNFYDAGAVVTFEWDGTEWVPKDTILGDQPKARIGTAIDLSYDGTRLVIGAPNYDVSFSASYSSNEGAVFLYHYDTTGWNLKLTVSGSHYRERLGEAVAISGNGSVVIIGAPQFSPTYPGSSSWQEGRVLIYKWKQISWRIEDYIVGSQKTDNVGSSIAVDFYGNWIAFKKKYISYPYGPDRGKVILYKKGIGNSWDFHTEIVGSQPDSELGRNISFLGKTNRIAISSQAPDSTGGLEFYYWNGTEWTFARYLSKQVAIPYIISSNLTGDKFVLGYPLAQNTTGDYDVGIALIIDNFIMPYFTSDTLTACDSFVSPSGKVWFDPGTYYDTTIAENGCDSIIEYNITDVQTTEPVVLTSYNNTLIANYSSPIYVWFNCMENGYELLGTTLHNTYVPSISGNFAVGVYQGECLVISNCITITPVENPKTNSIKSFISNDKLNIQLNEPINEGTITIFNIDGRKIFHNKITPYDNVISFDLSHINSKIFIINITTQKDSWIFKVVR